MRLVQLCVEGYQAIERANVELGPGLNILYGSNDLGKSTLAAALRSVLLVPPGTTAGEGFAPWYADAVPRVTLTFTDETDRYWKVEKRFGSGGAEAAATLSQSRDGIVYALHCRSRQVEEELRNVLGWGIPAPGGRAGPRGLPTSFLASVLLGAQTDVDGILAKSLADDASDSGKVRLTKALAVLAQDPIFKQVLDNAQTEVDTYFTANGRRKAGQASPFTAASNRVKERQREIAGLETELAESLAIENLIGGLRERFARGIEAVAQHTHQLETLQARAHREQARGAARLALEAARGELAGVEAHAQRIAKLGAELEGLKARVGEREADSRRAAAELDAANLTLQGVEETHRIATGEGAERERELRRAQCAEKAASAAQRRQTVEARRERIRAVVDARATAAQAAQAVARARNEQEKTAHDHTVAQKELGALEAEQAGWLATVAYGRWQTAVEAAAEREQATGQASAHLTLADAKDADAAREEAAADERAARLASRLSRLPTAEQLGALVQLERDLQLAEAALGGGLSVSVKGRAGLAGRVAIDGQAPRELTALDVEQRLEAERRLLLSIDDFLQVEVSAGAPEKRSAAETLRARRAEEVVPVLELAGLASLAEVEREAATSRAERAAVDQARVLAVTLRAAAQSLRERAEERRLHAEKLGARGDEVPARRTALGTQDIAALKARFDGLGAGAESKADARATQCVTRIAAAREALTAREKAATFAQFQLTDAHERDEVAGAAYAAALAPLETDAPDALLASVESELTALRTEESAYGDQLARLAAESTTEVANAARALTAARERIPLTRQAAERAVAAADAARQEHATRHGELSTLQAQLDSFNRDALTATVRQREADVAAFGTEPDLPLAALEAAKQQLDRASRERDQSKEELNQAEGKLSNAGGAALHENVERLREALQNARDDEQEVEVEAEAWRLLRDTLREVENVEGAHLGRALAGPLTAKFRELTADRYQTLLLNPLLKVEAVGAATSQATGADVLAALSVGTRDQLATLIRLAIAEELGSTIVLDDHLVHSDPGRLAWFRHALVKAAVKAQVIVLTCRPQDYLSAAEMPQATPSLDLAGGAIRAVDLARVMTRYRGSATQSAQAAPESNVERVERARASSLEGVS
jgi:hypothetical protein